ncbi:MAG: hypothetical protein JEZ11_25265 [Desulfobacterales bacterium]|nr:hypothetical protein [Desulfobacterales bacterium]
MGTVIGSFVGGLLAIGAAVFIYRKMTQESGSEPASGDPAPVAEQALGPEAEVTVLLEGLVNLNIFIRTTHGLSLESLQSIEEVIDLLRDTVPQMIARHPSESLTYELKRISGEHLAEIVKEFVDLSPDSRQRHVEAFIISLGDIREQIQRAKEIVENNEVAEFKVIASFLKTKYSSGGNL